MRTISALIVAFSSFLSASCTDAGCASFKAYGNPAQISCYSGGKEIYKGSSTGRIATVHNSDGWEFNEKGSDDFVRVSGDCIIRNSTK